MDYEQLESIRKILANFSEDPVESFVAWVIEDPEEVHSLVDKLNAFYRAKFDLQYFLEK